MIIHYNDSPSRHTQRKHETSERHEHETSKNSPLNQTTKPKEKRSAQQANYINISVTPQYSPLKNGVSKEKKNTYVATSITILTIHKISYYPYQINIHIDTSENQK